MKISQGQRRSLGPIVHAGMRATVVLLAVAALVFRLREHPGGMREPFGAWYGHWRAAALASILLLAFLLGSATPRRRGDWRNAGLASAFLGFNVQWPPIRTRLVAPVLVVMDVGLARWENRELEREFGEAFRAYAGEGNAFVPWRRQRGI